jgi:hypothetical protein
MMVYRIAEDKTEINEKVMDVKKGSVITKSQENPNQKPKTKGLKSKLRGLVSGKGIAKATKVKRGVKELGKKGCNKIKGLLPGPKKTAKQVSKHHTTPPPGLILMSTIMSHNRLIKGFAFLFKVIREPLMYCKLCLKINF